MRLTGRPVKPPVRRTPSVFGDASEEGYGDQHARRSWWSRCVGRNGREASDVIERAPDSQAAAVEDVCVDHGGLDILVTEEVLDRSDIVAILEQVGGEAVAKRVAAHAFGEAGGSGGAGDGALEAGRPDVMAEEAARTRITRDGPGGEGELPAPVGGCAGILVLKGIREGDGAEADLEISLMKLADVEKVVGERGREAFGEDGYAVLEPLTIADGDLEEVKVEVLDSQAQALHQAQAAAIEQSGQEEVRPGQGAKDPLDLVAAEDGGHAVGLAGADVLEGEGDLGAEDMAVEEEDGAEGLVLCRGGDLFVDGKVSEEALDVRGAHRGGMALVVEKDEATDPGQVGAFGAEGVVLAAQGLLGAVEQADSGLGHRVLVGLPWGRNAAMLRKA